MKRLTFVTVILFLTKLSMLHAMNFADSLDQNTLSALEVMHSAGPKIRETFGNNDILISHGSQTTDINGTITLQLEGQTLGDPSLVTVMPFAISVTRNAFGDITVTTEKPQIAISQEFSPAILMLEEPCEE